MPALGNDVAGSWSLFDQDTATGAIVDAIRGASQVVNAEFFVLTDAGKGAQLCGALVDAARRGVEVNVLVDFTSLVMPPVASFQRLRSELERAGGHVVVTSRMPFSERARSTPALKHVDHRKVVTVDGRVGFLGGMNFTTVTDGFHDSMIRLTQLPAARLAAEQLERWRSVGGPVSGRHEATVRDALGTAPRRPVDPSELDVISNSPDRGDHVLSDAYRELIRGAKTRIWVTTPGLSDQDVIGDLEAAARRGVDVRVVTSGEPLLHLPLLNWVGRSHLKALMLQGGSAYEIPETLHRKALLVDDTAILSSYNLTGRSRLHDHEIGVRSSAPDFVAAIEAVIGADTSHATKLDAARITGVGAWIGDLVAQKLKLSY